MPIVVICSLQRNIYVVHSRVFITISKSKLIVSKIISLSMFGFKLNLKPICESFNISGNYSLRYYFLKIVNFFHKIIVTI